ncbi:MAG: hypothetical protein J6V07_04860 [Clostridia bacterium]|nr:hypothetical protein [Clostridia bacterium]
MRYSFHYYSAYLRACQGAAPFSSVAPTLTVIPHATEGVGEEERRALYPYGCAKLRMTKLPTVK